MIVHLRLKGLYFHSSKIIHFQKIFSAVVLEHGVVKHVFCVIFIFLFSKIENCSYFWYWTSPKGARDGLGKGLISSIESGFGPNFGQWARVKLTLASNLCHLPVIINPTTNKKDLHENWRWNKCTVLSSWLLYSLFGSQENEWEGKEKCEITGSLGLKWFVQNCKHSYPSTIWLCSYTNLKFF